METPAHTLTKPLPTPGDDHAWDCVATVGTLVFSRSYSGNVSAQTAARAVAWEVLLEHGLSPRPRNPAETGGGSQSACTPTVIVHVTRRRMGGDYPWPTSRHAVRCSCNFDWRA